MRRLIIALDQDNFYVGVARRLDPSLEGRPIGITQKSLLATVSYEARALGLGKLQSIRSACDAVRGMGGRVIDTRIGQRHSDTQHTAQPDVQHTSNDKKGPELLLVDGEDLSSYRRASCAVKWIVDAVVGADGERGVKRKRGEKEVRWLPYAEGITGQMEEARWAEVEAYQDEGYRRRTLHDR
ncbi:hypothetical protein QFC20_005424 [Naganishia adeliensis]|uniref:Uncharacterized protein n=1 Tax=Naganishia adeliensis TaxID=92952 RepID=A0ACC2VLV6_9TREE|nr:hypothetical protein QFC20_005424 [Naganishia adeliensis]